MFKSVEDVAAVQEPVEQRGDHHLVAGEDRRPDPPRPLLRPLLAPPRARVVRLVVPDGGEVKDGGALLDLTG